MAEKRPADPLALVAAALDRFPPGRAVSVLIMARDSAGSTPEEAEAAFLRWRSVFNEVAWDAGGTQPLVTKVLFSFVGPPGQWDRVNVTRYPNASSFLSVLRDPRIHAAFRQREAALEDVSVMLLEDVAF